MFKKIALAAAIAIVASSSFAADKTPFYVGADVGTTKISGSSDRKTSFGGVVGYQITDNFAVEGGYRRLMSDTYTYQNVAVDVSLNQTAASVIGSYPIATGLNVFGRLGYNHLSADAKKDGFSASDKFSSGALFGIGMGYDVAPNVAIRAEFQRLNSDFTNFSVGVAYKF